MALIKRFLPRSLFGRWLVLLVTPMVLLQVFSVYAFYERHWDTVSRRLALGLAGEIALLIESRQYWPDAEDQRLLRGMAARHMQVEVRFEPGARLPSTAPPLRPYSILDSMLNQGLSERLSLPYQIDTRRGDEQIEVAVQLEDGVMRVLTLQKRVFSTSTYIFIMWMVAGSLVLLGIAIVFLRNQIRPIRRLAEAADAFGKGRDDPGFHPAGATEIRRAAAAFMAMKERIRRQIAQRTEMLAGVSHDLRTPLTRMKLQLAMLGEGAEVDDLKRDVAEMERMIEGYLAFARGQDGEAAVETDLAGFLADIVGAMRRQGANVSLKAAEGIRLAIRPDALRRCVANLIDNATRYARTVEVGLDRQGNSVEIVIDDDGPGIPPDQREAVFRPFLRLDAARDPNAAGVGLGLTIARDVMRSHGGDIELGTAPKGGLRALLRLPI
jgi:two-component system osmolarity sensor histidine kinase EnvZ